MQSLSKEIAQLVEQRKEEEVAELTTEYLDRFVHLLSDTHREADYLHKQLLKSLIEHKFKEQKRYKVLKGAKIYDRSILGRIAAESEKAEYVKSSEAAEIGGVSDQTIRRWCEKGKFPGAFKTDGGHWRIPQKFFKMTLQEARKADSFMKDVDENTREQFGGEVDEFDLDLDYS
ncbi:helix-turn-helix domain-containing protein [Sutcliffiella horikoshii]|nr:helix-turn-helix domain-containing protein [Sutcliffiella horikoshii]